MLQEIERCAVSLTNAHEVYPCSPHPHQHWDIIETTFFNVIQWNYPCKDAKCEIQRLRGETDNECSVVHRVEKEQTEKAEEDGNKSVQASSIQAPDKQQEEEARERQEERLCPVRRNSLAV